MTDTIKAHISTKGDMSVGLWPIETTIDLCLSKDDLDAEELEDTRTDLQACFTNIWGEDAKCIFSFELEEM